MNTRLPLFKIEAILHTYLRRFSVNAAMLPTVRSACASTMNRQMRN